MSNFFCWVAALDPWVKVCTSYLKVNVATRSDGGGDTSTELLLVVVFVLLPPEKNSLDTDCAISVTVFDARSTAADVLLPLLPELELLPLPLVLVKDQPTLPPVG